MAPRRVTWWVWLFALAVGLAVEAFARLVPNGNVWADRLVMALGVLAAASIIARGYRQT